MEHDAKLLISDSMEGFIRSIPEDLRTRLSLYDIDRLYKITSAEMKRMRDLEREENFRMGFERAARFYVEIDKRNPFQESAEIKRALDEFYG